MMLFLLRLRRLLPCCYCCLFLVIRTTRSSCFAFARSSSSSIRSQKQQQQQQLLSLRAGGGCGGESADEVNMAASETTTTTASKAKELGLFWSTPLIKSKGLTERVGKDVYLKLDALQTSGSFKDRGMGHLCSELKSQNVKKLISSSGGNAGLAVATVGRELDMVVEVVVPQTTKQLVIAKLESLGADVTVHGENWNAADLLARQRVDEDQTHSAAYISPYDHPLLWEGHSSLVDEIFDQLGEQLQPGAIIVSVGGGGLLCGTLEGLERRFESSSAKTRRSAVLACETEGAASFGQAWKKGEIVRLKGINSVATSLGALEVTPVALERAQRYTDNGGTVRECICTDEEAIDACLNFAQDHRILVEPACGAALAACYSDRLRSTILQDIDGPIVIVVCGGSGVNLELLNQWKQDIITDQKA